MQRKTDNPIKEGGTQQQEVQKDSRSSMNKEFKVQVQSPKENKPEQVVNTEEKKETSEQEEATDNSKMFDTKKESQQKKIEDGEEEKEQVKEQEQKESEDNDAKEENMQNSQKDDENKKNDQEEEEQENNQMKPRFEGQDKQGVFIQKKEQEDTISKSEDAVVNVRKQTPLILERS